MTLTVAPSFDALIVKLGDFIASILPSAPDPVPPVIQMPANRVSMPPPVPGFVGMTPRTLGRIATNFESWDADNPLVDSVELTQAVRVAVQCDFYGAQAANWAAMFSTVMRSEYGCRQLTPIAAPLDCESPRMAPLVDGEEEYETRWIVTAYVEYNPVTSTPEQFATVLEASLINVDVDYPP